MSHQHHEKAMQALIRLLDDIRLKSIAGSCTLNDVHLLFERFEHYAIDHIEGALYAAEIFTIGHMDYHPMRLNHMADRVRLLPTAPVILTQLVRMGRLWHDRQELDDFLLLLTLKSAERVYQIEDCIWHIR